MERAQVKPQVGGRQIAEKERLLVLQWGLYEAELAGIGAHRDAADMPMDEELAEAEAKRFGKGNEGIGKAKW
jgi:hypothetical protein